MDPYAYRLKHEFRVWRLNALGLRRKLLAAGRPLSAGEQAFVEFVEKHCDIESIEEPRGEVHGDIQQGPDL